MKIILTVILFSLGTTVLQAQDSSAVSAQKAYIFLGGAAPLRSSQHFIANVFGIAKIGRKVDIGAGFYGRNFTDNRAGEFNFPEGRRPIHELGEMNVSLGKILDLNKISVLAFFAGPSFVQYVMPYNLRKTHSGGWKGTTNSEFDTRTYYLPGFSARADLLVLPLQNISLTKEAKNKSGLGVGVGGLINVNREITSWGLSVNLVIGLQ